eukprot:GHVN01067751.1.p1 GENE.GHVN01067751.1~~GHVN01067751.1.p1  ORF type:complete len:100 (+),score=10.47 GHVN01067751.1:81-380(+)
MGDPERGSQERRWMTQRNQIRVGPQYQAVLPDLHDGLPKPEPAIRTSSSSSSGEAGERSVSPSAAQTKKTQGDESGNQEVGPEEVPAEPKKRRTRVKQT